MNNLLQDLYNLLHPRYCAVCGNRLNPSEQKLCAKCLMRLPYLYIADYYDNLVSRAFWGRIPVERAYSHFRYLHDSEAHLVLMHLKYQHRPDIGVWWGRLVARELEPQGFFDEVNCIVPVPLHWRRYLKRGYNQSTQIARGIAKVTGLPLLDSYVRRVRNNESQTRKTLDERLANVENLFRLRRPIPYSRILLVDDVVTTGATLTSCAQAILSVQPEARISVLTLAKA